MKSLDRILRRSAIRPCRHARNISVVLLLTVVIHGSKAVEPHGTSWKKFRNRDGLSILYPAQWGVTSCHACPDPSEPGVYADFAPRQTSPSISVGVYPDDRYMDLPLKERLRKLEARLRPGETERLRVRDFLLNGLTARTILYQNTISKYQSEFTITSVCQA